MRAINFWEAWEGLHKCEADIKSMAATHEHKHREIRKKHEEVSKDLEECEKNNKQMQELNVKYKQKYYKIRDEVKVVMTSKNDYERRVSKNRAKLLAYQEKCGQMETTWKEK